MNEVVLVLKVDVASQELRELLDKKVHQDQTEMLEHK